MSLAFKLSVLLASVVEAAVWRYVGTFTLYYLSDVSRLSEDGSYGISSAVVAQHAVTGP